MPHDYCLICKATLAASSTKVDIQLNTTDHNKNIEDFMKESILGVHAKTSLESVYLCQACYKAINRLEDFLIKIKNIQQDLLRKYLDNEPAKVYEAEEIIQDSSLMDIDKDDDGPYNEITEVFIKSENVKRKSPRKRSSKKVVSKFSDSDEPEDDHLSDYETTKEEIKSEKQEKPTGKKEKSKIKAESNIFDDDIDPLQLPKYCCELCGKQYDKANGFRLHMRDHKNENRFNCKFCNKNFTQKSSLDRHMNIHENSYPYKCDMCCKQFNHQSSYKIHQQIHLGKRDHICDLCGVTFLTKQHLNRHFKTHTKEKNHGCSICGQKFAETYNLKAHVLKLHKNQDAEEVSHSAAVESTASVISGEKSSSKSCNVMYTDPLKAEDANNLS